MYAIQISSFYYHWKYLKYPIDFSDQLVLFLNSWREISLFPKKFSLFAKPYQHTKFHRSSTIRNTLKVFMNCQFFFCPGIEFWVVKCFPLYAKSHQYAKFHHSSTTENTVSVWLISKDFYWAPEGKVEVFKFFSL